MKLFVDDLRPAPPGWQVARTITAAIEWLARGVVEEVSLDHDIVCLHPTCSDRKGRLRRPRGFAFKICESDTFMPVALYIKIMVEKPKIRIHTANTAAGYRMANLLEQPYDFQIFNMESYR